MSKPIDRLHVLVVDDDAVVLMTASEILRAMGHSTATHDHGLGTSSVLLDEKPHVVLLDIQMPDLDGDQLVRIINKRCWDSNAPWPIVILHSGRNAEELERVVKATNAAGAIQKTSDVKRFVREFEEIVERCAGGATAD